MGGIIPMHVVLSVESSDFDSDDIHTDLQFVEDRRTSRPNL